jgi:hypothetical protein
MLTARADRRLAECKDEDISPTSEHYYLRPEEGVPVVCNVYDLSWGAEEKEGGKKKKVNSGLPGMGFGIYHSGIEVYGREISFGYSDDGSTGVTGRGTKWTTFSPVSRMNTPATHMTS